jgi:regulator of ribosome biosynthesis
MPREKPVPEPKPETKWEKFAREKGIKKTKRDRMVYDETTDEIRPRYGYKRVSDEVEDVPIIEVKNGQDPFADPWEARNKDKKTKVAKNQHNRLNNQIRASGGKTSRFGKFSCLRLAAAINAAIL